MTAFCQVIAEASFCYAATNQPGTREQKRECGGRSMLEKILDVRPAGDSRTCMEILDMGYQVLPFTDVPIIAPNALRTSGGSSRMRSSS